MGILAGIYALIGNVNFIKGNHEEARKFFIKAVNGRTKRAVTYLNYSIMLLREGNWQEALSLLERGMLFKHSILVDKNMLVTMGSCYWVSGDVDKAIETLENMREKYPYVNANVLTTLGFMYFLKGEDEKAIEITQKAIEDNGESGAAWDNLGQIYFRQGELTVAKEMFEKAVYYKPGLPDSLYYLGVIAESENEADEAKDYFKRTLECEISALNTVTRAQAEEKYAYYANE